VNKSDLDGAIQLYQALRDFIGNDKEEAVILKTSVKKNKGIKELATVIKDIMKQKIKDKKNSEKIRLESELEDIILNNVKHEISAMIGKSKSFSIYLKKVQNKKIDPFEAADKLTKNFLK
jgi:LAO/AO transport system kinase